MLLRELIVQYRKEHNLSQRAFAEKCDLTNGYISMIEKNLNPSTGKPLVPTFATLRKIAMGMNITVHKLVQLADDMDIDIGETDSEVTEIFSVSKPTGNMKADEIRKFLHETIDQLSDSDLEFFKDFTLRMRK